MVPLAPVVLHESAPRTTTDAAFSGLKQMSQPPDVFGLIRYLANEKERMAKQKPPGIPVFIGWRNHTYIGSFQEIVPEFTREIILLNKSPQPISEDFKNAVLAFDKNRLCLEAEPTFDLQARIILLRRSGERLMSLTKDQEEFLQREGLEVTEEATGQTITVFSPQESPGPISKGTNTD